MKRTRTTTEEGRVRVGTIRRVFAKSILMKKVVDFVKGLVAVICHGMWIKFTGNSSFADCFRDGCMPFGVDSSMFQAQI